MKIAIFGVEGQLGSDVRAKLTGHELIPVDENTADVTSEGAVREVLETARPEWTINCTAMTNVEMCESQAEAAFAVNALGARHIARACSDFGSKLLHISTDYVFDGCKKTPYVEGDPVRPINVYGLTKLAGEWFVEDECPSHYIVRTSGLYGLNVCIGKGTNFVETMLRLASERDSLTVVSDERLTPTYTVDLASQIKTMLERVPAFGVYHATNEGSCSWYEFATEIFAASSIDIDVSAIASKDWKTAARRATNTVLENAALKNAGCNTFPHWKDALHRYLASRSD